LQRAEYRIYLKNIKWSQLVDFEGLECQIDTNITATQ